MDSSGRITLYVHPRNPKVRTIRGTPLHRRLGPQMGASYCLIYKSQTVVDLRIALPRRPVRDPLECIIYHTHTRRNRLEHESPNRPASLHVRKSKRSDLGTAR
jgi:hypothetical protein